MLQVKSYAGSYDKNEFYMIMGKYFAERIYRKRLPYLINDRDKIWHLFYLDDTLAGFAGIKLSKSSTNITDIYYLDNNNDILEFMINFIVETYKTETIKVLTNNSNEINVFKLYGFKEKGNKGSYKSLELGDDN